MSDVWHCYPERGETYEQLVAKYGKEAMVYAVLHLPQLDMAELLAAYETARSSFWSKLTMRWRAFWLGIPI